MAQMCIRDRESSIVAIENGQVTGRKVGDGPSHVVLEALRGDREKLQDHLCYLTKTKDGKILKSTTIYILSLIHISKWISQSRPVKMPFSSQPRVKVPSI